MYIDVCHENWLRTQFLSFCLTFYINLASLRTGWLTSLTDKPCVLLPFLWIAHRSLVLRVVAICYFEKIRPTCEDPQENQPCLPLLQAHSGRAVCRTYRLGRMSWRGLWLLWQQFKYFVLLSCKLDEFKAGRTSFRGSAALLGWGLNRFSAVTEHFGSTLLLELGWIQNTCFEKTRWKASMMRKHGKSGITHEQHLAYLFNQGRLKARAVLHVGSSSTLSEAPHHQDSH